jgi:hypothetical protein
MARFIKTISADGGTSGGSAGLSAKDVCNQICKLSTEAAGTPGTTVATSLDSQVNEISGGFGEWKMICNCPCWTECYGCQVIWNFDTTKYSAFKLVYRGMRLCACCYMYLCGGIGNPDCFCNCQYAYMGACVCCWPQKSCCCWDSYYCNQMFKEACVYCCNSPCDDLHGFEWTIWSPKFSWGGPKKGGWVNYDFRYKKFIRNNWDNYGWQSEDRHLGTVYCHCIFWSPCQVTDNRYFSRLCMKTANTPFQSALAAGQYNNSIGGACAGGQPCWTIWGKPCFRPEFGTCSMTT